MGVRTYRRNWDGEHIDGIVSERDIVRGLSGQLAAMLDEPVRSIMTSKVFTVSPDDDVEPLMALMTERRIRHVPVVDDGDVVGMVSIGDLVKFESRHQSFEIKYLTDYITGH